ncbi:origin recognition complex subunit 4 [Chelonus insularis]|uniref:origin recognition complex subunit 4 n=1 Tax=Chelonus insularis TaxID=460826 RepID=UPI00158BB42B|nr:origin recognition complex subunit 4 [Chelonus insularis]
MSVKRNVTIQSLDNNTFNAIRQHLKQKILYPEVKENQYVKERQHLLDLLKRTVDKGESNSALLIGCRGSGKTTTVNHILKQLLQLKRFKTNVMIIRLNGLIHTDDRLALIDISCQMKLENVFEEKVFGTFAENFNYLLECLRAGDKTTSVPCIFIIEEFDLFCNHHNQSLIYNLFDVAQSAQAPICVLGITCRFDVIELLEKRVKSRFSHRQIFFYSDNLHTLEHENKSESQKIDFDHRMDLLHDLLSVNKNDVKIIEKDIKLKISSQELDFWNKNIDDIVKNNDVVKIIKMMYQLNVTERLFRNFLLVLVSALDVDHQRISVNDFQQNSKLFLRDDKVFILEGLSILEFSLIISMKHETEIFDGEPFTFESVVKRYIQFANRSSSIQTVQKPVIMKAFEHLKNLELIKTCSNNSKTEKEYQHFELLVPPSHILQAANNYPGLPTDIAQWATSSLQ